MCMKYRDVFRTQGACVYLLAISDGFAHNKQISISDLATTCVEISRKYGCERIGDYESAAGLLSLHSTILIRQWDPGEPNCPMVATAYEYSWNVFFNFLGLLNFVFDRGKFWCAGKIWQQGPHISALRTRLFYLFMGLSIPQYFSNYLLLSRHGPSRIGSTAFNNIERVFFSSHATVAIIFAYFLVFTMSCPFDNPQVTIVEACEVDTRDDRTMKVLEKHSSIFFFWKTQTREEPTCGEADFIKQLKPSLCLEGCGEQIPFLCLEDKAEFKGGGIDGFLIYIIGPIVHGPLRVNFSEKLGKRERVSCSERKK